MYQDVLRDSWVYQEIGQEYLEKGLEKGRQQGIEQALHQTLMIYVETRFPQLVVLAQQQTGFIADVAVLNQIMSTLFALQTSEEVEQYLRKLGDDATKS
jgi:predicted transposase YdaD